jgi:DNA helicase-2/ATP-dependent DNA helicase PcrA
MATLSAEGIYVSRNMDYLNTLNPAQREAVTTTKGPLLILAGAGTGKTGVLTARIGRLVDDGVPANRIMAVTFTNKAAREMRARVDRIVGAGDSQGVLISTFHALCVRILRREAHRLGYDPHFSIYDESDSMSVIRKILSQESVADERLNASEVRAFISGAKNKGWRFEPSGDTLLDGIFQRYQESLQKCNALDFDDLLGLTVRLFSENEQVLGNWRRRFDFVMVDEFQDTNSLHGNCPLAERWTSERLCCGRRRPEHLCVERR